MDTKSDTSTRPLNRENAQDAAGFALGHVSSIINNFGSSLSESGKQAAIGLKATLTGIRDSGEVPLEFHDNGFAQIGDLSKAVGKLNNGPNLDHETRLNHQMALSAASFKLSRAGVISVDAHLGINNAKSAIVTTSRKPEGRFTRLVHSQQQSPNSRGI